MNSSINVRLYSPAVMSAAGFSYTHRDDTTRCPSCGLEVSCWTYDMKPLTVHSQRSPHCSFIRRNQSSNNFQASSLSTFDSIAQGPTKRQKTDANYGLFEVGALKQYRYRTFSHWPHPISFRYRMAEAGFFGCNTDNRAICIRCDLICHQWNIELDDPCEVHKKLSPDCPFVKSMLYLNYNNNGCKSPTYLDYVDPQTRLSSFSNWSNQEFPSVEKLVEAGFFCNNGKITCFYCDDSFQSWSSHYHPLAEHVRWNPRCNYARQLCSEELFDRIQRASKPNLRQLELSALNGNRRRSDVLDDETISKFVAARLDLSSTKYLEEKYDRSIIEHCWRDHFDFTFIYVGDDFIDGVCDLQIACLLRQKQIDLICIKKKPIIVPSIALKEMYEKRQIPFFNNFTESYDDLLASFENNLQMSKNLRRESGRHFVEDIEISIERENSFDTWPYVNPSRRDMIIGGWNKLNTEDCTTKCSHCHMQYYNWKSDDNPLKIHQYLSPFCPFVLSSNPFGSNSIPIRNISEQFTDEDIRNAALRPYTGLVRTKHESVYEITKRQNSFVGFPPNCPIDFEQLARAGFFYTQRNRSIQCFYCNCRVFVPQLNLVSIQHLKRLPHLSRCRYNLQSDDIDPYLSTLQASNKCTWCMTEDKHLSALPCRHFCLCKSCGQIKRLCPICKLHVTAYVVTYPA